MSDRRHDAMKHAVVLAQTGRFRNWWTVAARLRAKRYQESDMEWTGGQRNWLDRLCREASLVREQHDPWRPHAA